METCFPSHFYANFHQFLYDEQLKQQICYSFILPIPHMFFNPFNIWQSGSCRLHQVSPILMFQMFFPQIQQAPGPNFRKIGKSQVMTIIT